MTFDEALRKVLQIFPEATVEEDLDGQLLIFTGMKNNPNSISKTNPDLVETQD